LRSTTDSATTEAVSSSNSPSSHCPPSSTPPRACVTSRPPPSAPLLELAPLALLSFFGVFEAHPPLGTTAPGVPGRELAAVREIAMLNPLDALGGHGLPRAESEELWFSPPTSKADAPGPLISNMEGRSGALEARHRSAPRSYRATRRTGSDAVLARCAPRTRSSAAGTGRQAGGDRHPARQLKQRGYWVRW
jgi:hypothetical protein